MLMNAWSACVLLSNYKPTTSRESSQFGFSPNKFEISINLETLERTRGFLEFFQTFAFTCREDAVVRTRALRLAFRVLALKTIYDLITTTEAAAKRECTRGTRAAAKRQLLSRRLSPVPRSCRTSRSVPRRACASDRTIFI